jgi:AraC-like DNA-binding protein
MLIENNQLFTIECPEKISVTQKQFENIVLMYVAQGNILIDIDHNKFQLGAQHIFIVNSSNTISIAEANIQKNSQVYLLHLNTYEVQLILEKPFVIFTNLERHTSEEWYAICQTAREIITYYIGKDEYTYGKAGKSTYQFPKLIQHTFFCRLLNAMLPFLLSEQDCVYENAPQMMNQVFWYIQSHYTERITLQKIAAQYYVSDSSLSRWIKQYTGMPFEKYLRRLRAVHCALEISNTDTYFTEIALKHGFANPAALNKAFHEFYHMTPGQYRQAHLPHWEKGTVYQAPK